MFGPPNSLLLLIQSRCEPERNVRDSDLIDRHQVYLIVRRIENREEVGQPPVTHFHRPVPRLAVGVKEQDIVFDAARLALDAGQVCRIVNNEIVLVSGPERN
jgi:hypothetical protein